MMGRRGPAPTPTEILKLRGSTLVTKRRDQSEPKAPKGKPRCPDWLDKDAKTMWRHLVPLLDAMGVLTRLDGNALARYCRLWSRWRKAEAFIDKNGEMFPIRQDNGQVKYFGQWPQVAIAHKLALQLTRLEQELGMTPAARTRVQVSQPAQRQTSDKSHYFTAG